MTEHKYAEMIKSKAYNMDLVVFVRMAYGDPFTVAAEKECIPSFHPDNKYFLCLPKHKDACLHWLNGGEIEFNSEFVDEWTGYDPFKEWGAGSIFMQDDYKIRIKPRKEKRWIAKMKGKSLLASNGLYKSISEASSVCGDCEFYEIEVEV